MTYLVAGHDRGEGGVRIARPTDFELEPRFDRNGPDVDLGPLDATLRRAARADGKLLAAGRSAALLRAHSEAGDPVAEAIVPILGEPLNGIIFRSAATNMHGSTTFIAASAGLRTGELYRVGVSSDLDERRLARVLGVPLADVLSRRTPIVEKRRAMAKVDFFGATVPSWDLILKRRRVSPAALRQSPHQRALAGHGLVPFCHEHGEMLIDQCPRCGASLTWAKAEGVDLCPDPNCLFDLREARTCRIDEPTLERVRPLVQLLDPDPAIHGSARSALTDDLRVMNRGETFEFAWRFGRIALNGGVGPRLSAKALAAETIVDTLATGADIITDWPGRFLDLISKRLSTSGGEAALTLAAAFLRAAWSKYSYAPSHGEAMRRFGIEGTTSHQRLVRAAVPGAMNGSEAAAYVGISHTHFVRLHRSRVFPALVEQGDENKFASFRAEDLQELKTAVAVHVPLCAASERLGISHHGVEQLMCLGILQEVGREAFRVIYSSVQFSCGSLDALVRDVEARSVLSGTEDLIPLYRAIMIVGGREKPWGPIFCAIVQGRLPIRLVEKRGKNKLAERIDIRRADLALIATLEFDRSDHPEFPFRRCMPRRDAHELLNIHPTGLSKTDLASLHALPSGDGKRLEIEPLLLLARRLIAPGEISMRWSDGTRPVPPFMRLRRQRQIIRLGTLGWDRADVERRALAHANGQSERPGGQPVS